MSVNHGFQHQTTQHETLCNGPVIMSAGMETQQLPFSNNEMPQVGILPSLYNGMPIDMGSEHLFTAGNKLTNTHLQSHLPANNISYQLLSANDQVANMQTLPTTQNLGSSHLASNILSSANRRPSGIDPFVTFDPSMFANVGPRPLAVRPVSTEVHTKTKPTVSASVPNRKRQVQMEPTPSKAGSFESVRSKLRESLASSLAMVIQENKLENEGKDSSGEAVSPDGKAKKAIDLAALNPKPTEISSSGTSFENSSKKELMSNIIPVETSLSIISHGNPVEQTRIPRSDVEEPQLNPTSEDEVLLSSNLFMNDELLQGHGLCWAVEADIENAGSSISRDAKRPKLENGETSGHVEAAGSQNSEAMAVQNNLKLSNPEKAETSDDVNETSFLNPETLAVLIEAELLKLYGGVNKKYKEKARSLLFNLKDRSNPELRRSVMLGEIAPERLCSMTAEDLASKELSQWRQAKAEELAQMVVLPDTEVDIRRLVRKTHKGEFQVEVEQDYGVSAEVAVGTSVLPQSLPKPGDEEDQNSSELKVTDGELKGSVAAKKNSSVSSNKELTNDLPTLIEGKNDLMQELMVEEKDPKLLPPILSLDEFMKDLDSEPPFQDISDHNIEEDAKMQELASSSEQPGVLEADAKSQEQTGPNEDSKSDCLDNKLVVGNLSKSSNGAVSSDSVSTEKPIKRDSGLKRSEVSLKFDAVTASLNIHPPDTAPKAEIIWEGSMQLNISSVATVVGFFRSGEKTSTGEWHNFLEIKGRVRKDAFEKFLKELRLSRTRAIMIVQFCWKEGSSEDGLMYLSEISQSYVADERVGFAEPAAGVELYLCPLHSTTSEMFGRHLAEEHIDSLKSANTGLIGVVVWRRPYVTTSPRLSTHLGKHSATKKQSDSRRQQNSISRSTFTSSYPSLPSPTPRHTEEDPNDDVPPGFGPNDEDLPEFDFASSAANPNPCRSSAFQSDRSHTQPPARREQMRNLVHKYGQSNGPQQSNLEIKPWNDDDEDDDIPEWKPNHVNHPQQMSQPQPLVPPGPPILPVAQNFHGHQQQQLQRPFSVNQHFTPSHQLLPQNQLQSQQFVPPSLQPPMHPPFVPGPPVNTHPAWQPQSQAPYQVNSMIQQPTNGQVYGIQPPFGSAPNVAGWRPDIPRSRGF